MTPKEKMKKIKLVLDTAAIAEYLGVSCDSVFSWTKSGQSARTPSPAHQKKIDSLYRELSPCLKKIKALSNVVTCSNGRQKNGAL